MRRLILALPLIAMMAMATSAFGQSNIAGSDHDLSGGGGGGEICKPCHVPHNAYPYAGATVKRVLWNHQETSQTFTMYTTEAGNTGAIDGVSKLCLSCHDGVTAVDNYGGTTNGNTLVTGGAALGTDLSNDHPIGVKYPPEDSGGAALDGYHATPSGNIKLFNVSGVTRVECASCHDPHGAGNGDFLREPKNGSALCLKCHDK